MRISNRFDALLLAITCSCSGVLSIILGQDGNWDLKNYHYYNAYSFLHDRLTYDLAPAQIQSFFNPLLDLPFYLLTEFVPPIVYGFIVGALQGLNIWLVYKITYVILSDLTETKRRLLSIASGVVGYYGAANIAEIGTTAHDNITSLLVLSALLLAFNSTQSDTSGSTNKIKINIFVSGLLIGCATGFKLTVAIYSLAFTLCIPFIPSKAKDKLLNTMLSGIGVCLGMIITIGYWSINLWQNFRNPLFPFYNRIFKSNFFNFENYHDPRFFPQDKYQILFYPFHFLKDSRLVSEAIFRDIRFSLCYILFILLLFMIYYNKVAHSNCEIAGTKDLEDSKQGLYKAMFFVAFFILSYVIWQYMFSIYRYLVPLELLSPVFIILIMRYILPFKQVYFKWVFAIFVLMAFTMVPMKWGRLPWTDSYFNVKIESVNSLDNATVIMADREPLSYIIPSFPKGARFVGVNNNFMKPHFRTKYHTKIKQILGNCDQNIYLLYIEKSNVDYDMILELYNLKMGSGPRKTITTKFQEKLALVPLLRIQ